MVPNNIGSRVPTVSTSRYVERRKESGGEGGYTAVRMIVGIGKIIVRSIRMEREWQRMSDSFSLKEMTVRKKRQYNERMWIAWGYLN